MRVYLTSPFIPAEWITAHGLEPCGVWLEEEASFPATSAGICPFANAMRNLADSQSESAVVFSSHCDQLRRCFDSVSQRSFLFNVPATQSRTAGRMFRTELDRLARFLLELGGHSPTSARLLEVMTHYQQSRTKLLEACPRLSPHACAEAMARFQSDGSLQIPNSPSADRHSDSIAIALLGGPLTQTNWQLFDILQNAGARVVLNATESGELSLLPTFNAGSADPVESLARGYLDNCLGVFQRPNTRLYDWLKQQLSIRNVRGIVLWHHVGCDLWRGEAQNLREAFGLPLLPLDAEESQFGSMRTVTRLEAFIELLRGRHP